MSVSTGFLKTAAAPRGKYKAIEKAVAGLTAVPTKILQRGQRIRKGFGEAEQAVVRGLRSGTRVSPASGEIKPPVGTALERSKIKSLRQQSRREGQPVLSGDIEKIKRDAPAEIRARALKIKRSQKPSFWQRHPVVSALAGAATYKALFGQKEDDGGGKAPPYVYPNQ